MAAGEDVKLVVGESHLSHPRRHPCTTTDSVPSSASCATAMLFAGAVTAVADTGTGPGPVTDTIDPDNPDVRGEGETIDDIDLPTAG